MLSNTYIYCKINRLTTGKISAINVNRYQWKAEKLLSTGIAIGIPVSQVITVTSVSCSDKYKSKIAPSGRNGPATDFSYQYILSAGVEQVMCHQLLVNITSSSCILNNSSFHYTLLQQYSIKHAYITLYKLLYFSHIVLRKSKKTQIMSLYIYFLFPTYSPPSPK